MSSSFAQWPFWVTELHGVVTLDVVEWCICVVLGLAQFEKVVARRRRLFGMKVDDDVPCPLLVSHEINEENSNKLTFRSL